MTDDSRTTDLGLGLIVLVISRMTSSKHSYKQKWPYSELTGLRFTWTSVMSYNSLYSVSEGT